MREICEPKKRGFLHRCKHGNTYKFQKVFVLRNKSPMWPTNSHPSLNLGGDSFLAVRPWRGVQKLRLEISFFLPWGQPLRSVLLMLALADVYSFSLHFTAIESGIPVFKTLSSPSRIGQLVWLIHQFVCLFILIFMFFMLLFQFSSAYIFSTFKYLNSDEMQLLWIL